MTALDDRPTTAEAARDGHPTSRLVVLDLDHPAVQAVLARWDPSGAHHMADDLAAVAEPVEQGEDRVDGYYEYDTGAFVGTRTPTYYGTPEEV